MQLICKTLLIGDSVLPDVDFVKPNPVILHLVPVTADAVPVIIISDLLYLLGAAMLALVFFIFFDS